MAALDRQFAPGLVLLFLGAVLADGLSGRATCREYTLITIPKSKHQYLNFY